MSALYQIYARLLTDSTNHSIMLVGSLLLAVHAPWPDIWCQNRHLGWMDVDWKLKACMLVSINGFDWCFSGGPPLIRISLGFEGSADSNIFPCVGLIKNSIGGVERRLTP
jgi:hypothetical protein